MARKSSKPAKTAAAVAEVSKSAPPQVFTCGDCSRTYGFCVAGADGLPIFCRCELDDQYLKMCSEKACDKFDNRGYLMPTEFCFGFSPRKERKTVAK